MTNEEIKAGAKVAVNDPGYPSKVKRGQVGVIVAAVAGEYRMTLARVDFGGVVVDLHPDRLDAA